VTAGIVPSPIVPEPDPLAFTDSEDDRVFFNNDLNFPVPLLDSPGGVLPPFCSARESSIALSISDLSFACSSIDLKLSIIAFSVSDLGT